MCVSEYVRLGCICYFIQDRYLITILIFPFFFKEVERDEKGEKKNTLESGRVCWSCVQIMMMR